MFIYITLPIIIKSYYKLKQTYFIKWKSLTAIQLSNAIQILDKSIFTATR